MTVDILIVVDVEQALIDNSLVNNLYMVDTNRFMGSYQEGSMELYTKCRNNTILKWRVESIAVGNDVEISKFIHSSGSDLCHPQSEAENSYWQGTVNGQVGNTETYHMQLTFNGRKTLEWDPYIEIVK